MWKCQKLQNENYQWKWSKYDFEMTCNAKYWWSCCPMSIYYHISYTYMIAVELICWNIIKRVIKNDYLFVLKEMSVAIVSDFKDIFVELVLGGSHHWI